MNEYKMYAKQVNRDQFKKLMEDYSESGYSNSSYSDIIIDLFNVEDHRAEFAELIGLTLDELPESGLMNLYP